MWQLLSAEGPDCSLVIPTIGKLDTEGTWVCSITSSDMARSSCMWKCIGNEDEEATLFFISCTFSHFATTPYRTPRSIVRSYPLSEGRIVSHREQTYMYRLLSHNNYVHCIWSSTLHVCFLHNYKQKNVIFSKFYRICKNIFLVGLG